MSIVDALRRAVTDGSSTFYECRNCGTTLSSDVEECGACGAEDVACYSL